MCDAARLSVDARPQAQRREEDDELDEDWKLLKKLKKGKISEHQYNVALGARPAAAPDAVRVVFDGAAGVEGVTTGSPRALFGGWAIARPCCLACCSYDRADVAVFS